jgi:hypothetical protein
LQQIALGDGGDGASDFRRRPKQIIDEGVDGAFHLAPGAVAKAELHALARLSFAAHDLADTLELLRHALVGGDDLVEGVGDLAQQADLTAGHAYREVPHAHGLQRIQKIVELGRCAAIDRAIGHCHRAWRRAVGLEFAGRLGVPWHDFLQARMNSHDVTGAAVLSWPSGHPAAIFGRVSRNTANGKGEREMGREVPPCPACASGSAPKLLARNTYGPLQMNPPTGWFRPCAYTPRCIPGRSTT